MSEQSFNVLFLCTGNSARSILAEAILRREGKGRFNAYSAGSKPNGEVNPYALELLNSLDYSISDFRSKSWDEFAGDGALQMDFIFTVCGNAAGEVCPVWPGHPANAHWGVPDPAGVTGPKEKIRAAFNEAYGMLNARISAFLSLQLDTLDQSSIYAELEKIGQMTEIEIGTY
jgi:arsenate reductase